MKLTAVKDGRYGFHVTASLHLSAEKDNSLFVFLDELVFTGGNVLPLFKVCIENGSYCLKVLRPMEWYMDVFDEFESMFLNNIKIVKTGSLGIGSFVLPEDASVVLYGNLCLISSVASLKGIVQASFGKDCEDNPLLITLAVNDYSIQ